jgi:preprotein translocase subunit SecY
MVVVIAAVILMTQATRKIPVQYAKRIVGRRMYGGASTHIPLRVNTAGVIPIIFASSILIIPATIAQFFPQSGVAQWVQSYFSPNRNGVWEVLYAMFIVFFTYFYTAVVLNPNDLAENMRKYGGFVPGIRPGKRTAEYIDRVMTRITLVGAVALALVAIIPDLVFQVMNVVLFAGFGGTSVLIVVGVALDTLQQIESHLLMRHYEGFVRKGRIRGRR